MTFLPNVFSQVSPSSCPVSRSIRVIVLINGSTLPLLIEHRHRVRHLSKIDIKWIHQRIQVETDFDTINHAEPLAEVHKMVLT